MITINKVEDVPVFIGLAALTEFLKDKVKSMLTTFETDNLAPYGSIYVIQSDRDWDMSNEIGLIEPLKDTPVEFAEIHTLENGHGVTIEVFHGCFCLSNSFSFDVYCPMYMMHEKAFYEWTANLVGGKNNEISE